MIFFAFYGSQVSLNTQLHSVLAYLQLLINLHQSALFAVDKCAIFKNMRTLKKRAANQ